MKKIDCPRCGGTGEIFSHYRIQDDGEITGWEPTGEIHWRKFSCQICEGTGDVDPDNEFICQSCEGTGKDSEGKECESCGGWGFDFCEEYEDELIEDTGDD